MKTIYRGTFGLLFILSVLLVQCKKSNDTPVTPKSSAKSLTNPVIDGVISATSTFDASTSTYTMTVPFGTVITALKLTFNLSTAATANPTSGSVQNFTNPITYTVTAEDGSTQNYTVKVTVVAPPKSTEKQILEFKFASLSPVVSATIDQTARKISATISVGVTALVPTITLSTKATVSPASGVAQNFTNPVSYTVTAEDGSMQTYEVTIIPSTVSTFDTDAEGWTISGDATTTTPIFSTTGGNPGGYMYSIDRVSGGVWYFVASPTFVGRAKSGYGKTLSFDLIQLISTDSQFDDDDVILEGNGLKLTFDTPYNPALKWTSYSIKLDETVGWKKGAVNATKAEIQGVLQNLTNLQIRGEFRNGPDTEGLDNVMIK